MRIRVAYEAGRDGKKGNPTGEFIKITEILKKIRNIEEAEYSKKKFMDFEEYMEALIAYHSYYYPNKGDNN